MGHIPAQRAYMLGAIKKRGTLRLAIFIHLLYHIYISKIALEGFLQRPLLALTFKKLIHRSISENSLKSWEFVMLQE